MTLTSVHPGDIVECEARGHRYLAVVIGRGRGRLEVEPIRKAECSIYKQGIYTDVTARQVLGHWRKRRSRR
jgi:hypothetical protein